jgi:hypothetical protein
VGRKSQEMGASAGKQAFLAEKHAQIFDGQKV